MNIIIRQASEEDHQIIAQIGRVAVNESHGMSCAAADMEEYLSKNYNDESIKKELQDPANIYHLIYSDGEPMGFSKVNLNAQHPNITNKNTTKLDRIYLLSKFHGQKLGFELLKANIELSKQHDQEGIWLFTWKGNEKAIQFYQKIGFSIIGSADFRLSANHSNPNHHMLLNFN